MAYPKHHLFPEPEQVLAHFGFVISHPARVRIIELLAYHGTLGKVDIMDLLPNLSATAVSDHLRYLERAQLIKIGSKDGNRTGYLLEHDRYKAYVRFLKAWLERVGIEVAA